MSTKALIDETMQETSAMDIDNEVCSLIETDDIFETDDLFKIRSNGIHGSTLPHLHPLNSYHSRSNSHDSISQYLQPMNNNNEMNNVTKRVSSNNDVNENMDSIFNCSEVEDAMWSYDWSDLPNTEFYVEQENVKPTITNNIANSNNSLIGKNDWNYLAHKQVEPDITTSYEVMQVDDAANESMKKKRKRNRNKPNYEPNRKKYVTPNNNDVLLGRGGRTNHHPGNQRYLKKKETIQPRYLVASKEAKTDISQELVDAVKQWGGRFLKQDVGNGKWYKVLNIVARKKASQTLREQTTPDNRKTKREKIGYVSKQKKIKTNNT